MSDRQIPEFRSSPSGFPMSKSPPPIRQVVVGPAGWQREHMSKNRLAIIPDQTHYDLFHPPRLVPTVLPFLDGKSQAAKWSGR